MSDLLVLNSDYIDMSFFLCFMVPQEFVKCRGGRLEPWPMLWWVGSKSTGENPWLHVDILVAKEITFEKCHSSVPPTMYI